jgi:hypothetical protein
MFILDFFDKEKNCRDDLKELKLEYFDEINNIDPKDCNSCKKRDIRDKYLNILLEGNYGF